MRGVVEPDAPQSG